MLKKIILADHYGFCMGVKRAIQIAEETNDEKDADVTILKEIVHNKSVVERFRADGIGQKMSVEEIDSGTMIVSAHGASPEVFKQAEERGVSVIDATCPLVTRIHDIVDKLAERDYRILHFGDHHHDETLGVIGHATKEQLTVVPDVETLMKLPEDMPEKLALTSQTTAQASEFAEAELAAKKRWPQIKIFNTICNATNQRQKAIMNLAPKVDLTLVVGSLTSANSLRLASMAEALCGRAYLIDSEADIDESWFTTENSDKKLTVGITAGASTPDFLIEGVVDRLLQISNESAELVRPQKRSRTNKLALQDECH
ncbi:MAG: 4-hydroxy-3-methylbut-2-enyl diphosphate reductase [candidate division Zixibacteria bacterium]|nr:4-hydroxy-3-methylbut-2-enyl diphosphate reductase [candidate division Zixibacteria bacterium]